MRCYCPDDCNCHHPWRPNYCGCRQHEAPTAEAPTGAELRRRLAAGADTARGSEILEARLVATAARL